MKRLGTASSTERSSDQTELAQFWADGPGSYTPPGHWNQIATELAAAEGLSGTATARLVAELNAALADAATTARDAKLRMVWPCGMRSGIGCWTHSAIPPIGGWDNLGKAAAASREARTTIGIVSGPCITA